MKILMICLLSIGCGGPAFTGIDSFEIEAGNGGEINHGGSTVGGSSVAAGGHAPIGGSTSGFSGAMAGGMAGEAPTAANWKCRIDEKLCQCYSDPSQFESGWLPLDKCPNSSFCTNRDESACVCWDNEASYQNALEIAGTRAVNSCP